MLPSPSKRPCFVYRVQTQAKLVSGVGDQDSGYPCGATQSLEDTPVGFAGPSKALILHWGAGYLRTFSLWTSIKLRTEGFCTFLNHLTLKWKCFKMTFHTSPLKTFLPTAIPHQESGVLCLYTKLRIFRSFTKAVLGLTFHSTSYFFFFFCLACRGSLFVTVNVDVHACFFTAAQCSPVGCFLL